MTRALSALLLLALLGAAVPGDRGTLTFFAERFYRGANKAFVDDQGDIRLGFAPRSIRAEGRWLVCSDTGFRGRCVELDSDYPVDAGIGISFNIRSLKGLAAGSGAGHPAPGVMPGGPSLIGAAAQFFAKPTYGKERALACPGGGGSMDCARETAADLCRRAGYREVRHFSLQTERGLNYLADVLCVKGSLQ